MNETNQEDIKNNEVKEEKPKSVRGKIRQRLQELENKVSEQAEQLNQERDRYLRLAAEFDNYRKRTATEYRLLQELAGERIMQAILPVIDDFDRLINHKVDNIELSTLQQGIRLIHQKLVNTLQREGLEPIEALNQPFDPTIHEAVAEMVDNNNPPGLVIVEVEKGYKLGSKIIRHSKVVVSKAPETPEILEASDNG